jgi:hypothetical protein
MKGEIVIKPLVRQDNIFVMVNFLSISSFVEMYDTKNRIIIEPK